jgi:hypothetical protein
MTFNEDKWRNDLEINVEVACAATIYVFLDNREKPPFWLDEQFTDTGIDIGLDEGSWPDTSKYSVDRGAGRSINQFFSGFDERYPTRGVHSVAINQGNGARAQVKNGKSGAGYTVEARAFDDGVAFRTIVPGDDRERVPDEATAFRLAPGSTVWYHNLRGHYEGVHAKKSADEVKNGDWAAVP